MVYFFERNKYLTHYQMRIIFAGKLVHKINRMLHYEKLKETHQVNYLKLKNKFSIIAIIRLALVVLIIFCVWQFIKNTQAIDLMYAFALLIGFIALLQKHQKIKYERNVAQKLVEINMEEINYINQQEIPFKDGKEYIDPAHLYTYDLDIFGPKSLFQHINRTATPSGEKTLAHKLSTPTLHVEIVRHQAAIKELANKIAYRQLFYAKAKLAKLDQEGYKKLINWSKTTIKTPHIFLTVLRVLMPILFFGMIAMSYYTENVLYTYLANTCFLLNLIVLAIYIKDVKTELISSEKIHETILQYALIFELIYEEEMQAEYLLELKKELIYEGEAVHLKFKKLSQLFNNLSSLENPVGAVFFNGALLYHLGVYSNLLKWKKKNAPLFEKYLHILGEFEALNALANFSFNNKEFTFPSINNDYKIDFKNCGHPLIHESKRICNDVNFNAGTFIILTGSNMSGKSTFLRTLGINMVLANTGAPVCSSKAQLHPLPVIVSMRMSDSLTDSESYFFAEVKRLKQMMDELDQQICFVLLDEILKGTNSDDKRLGTVKVVEKMVLKKAIGAIATHDLEVCNITSTYPNNLSNNCFEVEIVNNELVFDYKLRDGICKNKSATFLMKKMEII
jgi:DNA mismatch repair ATPase MutS